MCANSIVGCGFYDLLYLLDVCDVWLLLSLFFDFVHVLDGVALSTLTLTLQAARTEIMVDGLLCVFRYVFFVELLWISQGPTSNIRYRDVSTEI